MGFYLWVNVLYPREIQFATHKITDTDKRPPSRKIRTGLHNPVVDSIIDRDQLRQLNLLPPHWILDGIAEHSEEGGLEEEVELGEGLAALGPQRVRRIQNARDPLLLGEGGEGDLYIPDISNRYVVYQSVLTESFDPPQLGLHEVEKEATTQVA